MDAFRESVDWVCDPANFNDTDIDESKLSLFSAADKPVPPGSKGLAAFGAGMDHELRTMLRHRLLDVSRDDVVRAAQKHLKGTLDAGIGWRIGGRGCVLVVCLNWSGVDARARASNISRTN